MRSSERRERYDGDMGSGSESERSGQLQLIGYVYHLLCVIGCFVALINISSVSQVSFAKKVNIVVKTQYIQELKKVFAFIFANQSSLNAFDFSL